MHKPDDAILKRRIILQDILGNTVSILCRVQDILFHEGDSVFEFVLMEHIDASYSLLGDNIKKLKNELKGKP